MDTFTIRIVDDLWGNSEPVLVSGGEDLVKCRCLAFSVKTDRQPYYNAGYVNLYVPKDKAKKGAVIRWRWNEEVRWGMSTELVDYERYRVVEVLSE